MRGVGITSLVLVGVLASGGCMAPRITENYRSDVYNTAIQPNNALFRIRKPSPDMISDQQKIMEAVNRARAVTSNIRYRQFQYRDSQVLTPEEVLERGEGQCFERTVVAQKILREMGVDSTTAAVKFFVERDGQEEYELTKHYVNIVRIGSSLMVLDTTSDLWLSVAEYGVHWKGREPGLVGLYIFPSRKTEAPVLMDGERERRTERSIDLSSIITAYPLSVSEVQGGSRN